MFEPCHTQNNESCHKYIWVMSRRILRVRSQQASILCAKWRIDMCDITRPCVWHDAFTRDSGAIWMHHVARTHVARTHASCYSYESVMSHIWTRHVTHTNESCHTYECVTINIRRRHGTHTNSSYHTYERVMSHVRMRHVKHTNASCHTYERVISRHITHTNASCHTYEIVTSHLRTRHVTIKIESIAVFTCVITCVTYHDSFLFLRPWLILILKWHTMTHSHS